MMREYKRYNEYKDSGIEWIGEIPEFWVISKIKFYSNIESGEYISKDEYLYNGEFNIYGSNGKIGKTNQSNFNGNGLIIGRVGAAGEINYANRGWITDNALIIRTQNINERYFYFYLESIDFDIITGKTAQPIITATNFKNLNCLIPSKKEQQKIASFLDQKTAEIDKIISKKENLIDYLEKYKKSVITEAVTKGKFGNKYLNEYGQFVDEIEMKDSGIEWVGKVPKDWDKGKLGYLANITTGNKDVNEVNIFKEGIDKGEKYPFFSCSKDFLWSKNYSFNTKAILMAGNGEVGQVHYWDGKFEAYQRTYIIHNFKNNIYDRFVFNNLMFLFKDYIKTKTKGSVIDFIKKENLTNYPIFYPSNFLQSVILLHLEKLVNNIDYLLGAIEHSIQKHKKYKKSLIFEAVTGKIDLRDYEENTNRKEVV